jgi:hypothetical protein
MYITKKQTERLGKKFNIDFEIIYFDEWHDGLNIETEHGKKFGKCWNVTNNSLTDTAKIVVAHLIEDPRYYYFLNKQEKKRSEYWKTHTKPDIFC